MDWGADSKVLFRLYRSLVRSKLDYGCIVYGSARQSYLRKLDFIHNQGLQLALGAFRTSPINSLYVEANEPSLNLRTGGRIRRLPSCRVVKPHQWTCSFAVSCDLCHLMKGSWWLKHTTLAWS